MPYQFEDLKKSCHSEWRAYIEHSFIQQLGDASLAPEAFQHYLIVLCTIESAEPNRPVDGFTEPTFRYSQVGFKVGRVVLDDDLVVLGDRYDNFDAAEFSFSNQVQQNLLIGVPPNRDVPVNINYRLKGYVEYYTDDGGFYSNSMQADQCKISGSGTVGSNTKGTFYIHVLCVSHNSGTWPVYLTSTIPGLTAQAVGEIRAQ